MNTIIHQKLMMNEELEQTIGQVKQVNGVTAAKLNAGMNPSEASKEAFLSAMYPCHNPFGY